MIENKISYSSTSEEDAALNTAIETIENTLLKKLITLTPEEKRNMLHLGDKSIAFVDKANEAAQQHPGLVNSFIDVNEFNIDVKALGSLRSILFRLSKIVTMLEDSEREVGHEAYKAALQTYALFKQAAQMGHPGTEALVKEMQERFPGGRRKKEKING
ncbi:MAG: hypothetical protein MI739_07310 [Bacteroidales bacterium]|nr:hypothetical protein [Bacteroidales bacterium]